MVDHLVEAQGVAIRFRSAPRVRGSIGRAAGLYPEGWEIVAPRTHEIREFENTLWLNFVCLTWDRNVTVASESFKLHARVRISPVPLQGRQIGKPAGC